jgi:hypothetical protein
MTKQPDAYAALMAVAQDLERQGVGVEQIIDALFRLSVNAAIRIEGPDVVSATLRDVAELVADRAELAGLRYGMTH